MMKKLKFKNFNATLKLKVLVYDVKFLSLNLDIAVF